MHDVIRDEAGRVRVKVVQAEGEEVRPGLIAQDPDAAKPHFEKLGWCEINAVHPIGISNPKITLDDGTVLWGMECWWEFVKPEAQTA